MDEEQYWAEVPLTHEQQEVLWAIQMKEGPSAYPVEADGQTTHGCACRLSPAAEPLLALLLDAVGLESTLEAAEALDELAVCLRRVRRLPLFGLA